MNGLIYTYCLSNSPPDVGLDLGTEGLECLRFGDFFVIVKYVPESEFSEENLKKNVSDMQWLDSRAREHVRVISLIMEQCTVIPFNFGTIYQSENSLKKFIQEYSGSLIENLVHLDRKEEWGVKIYCDRKALSQQIDELSKEAAALETQIMASSPGKAFLLKRKKTELIEKEMDRICKNYGQEYYDEFNKLSETTRLNNLLPKEFTGREDTMILNAIFLVGRERKIEFISTIRQLKSKCSILGFDIESSGPWPPFSFISIKENK